MRITATLLAVCAAGCLPDPKVDPCRNDAVPSNSCDGEDASGSEPDAAGAWDSDTPGEKDGAIDEDAGEPTVDGEVDAAPGDADVEPTLDAGADAASDGSVELDSGSVDGAVTRPDASRPEAGVGVLTLAGDLGVHDPSAIEVEGGYIILSTGRGLKVKRSIDLLTWTDYGSVFPANPDWIASQVPGAKDLWAPDIAFFGGKYHLYYSASTFGSRNSCIGHASATNIATLNFVDHGPVICTTDSDDYNAIDPAFIVDESGTPWLSFGSFWSGIKLLRLDANGQRDGTELYSLASRDSIEAIEAPYLVRRGGFYYLFVSFDLCCRGTDSTYRIMVGRSENITGPYVDAEGNPMLSAGGGSMVVVGGERWRGPGHNSVLTLGEDQYIVYHAYDADLGGAAILRIANLRWDSNGWPEPVGP